MNFYHVEISRIKKACFANETQLQVAIDLKKFIDENYCSDVNLDRFSAIVFISKFHLLRIFKRHYGFTPIQYLIEKRLEKSRALLRQGVPVTNTCYMVGFETPSSFSTLFRRKMGLSPAQFQKRNFRKVISTHASELAVETK